MQLRIVGQQADNPPATMNMMNQRKQTIVKPPKPMDKATLIRLTVNCLPNQVTPILLKNASDHLRPAKQNPFKVSDLLFHSAQSSIQPKFKKRQQQKQSQQQSPLQSPQFPQKLSQGSLSLAAIDDLESNPNSQRLDYLQAENRSKPSSRPYFEEFSSLKESSNDFFENNFLEGSCSNANRNSISDNNSGPNGDYGMNSIEKQPKILSNCNSITNFNSAQVANPDEITQQLVKQNLMIFNRKRVIGTSSTRIQPNLLKNPNAFNQSFLANQCLLTTVQTERTLLQARNGSFKDEISPKNNEKAYQIREQTIGDLMIQSESLQNVLALRRQPQQIPLISAPYYQGKKNISQKGALSDKILEQTTLTTAASTVSSSPFEGIIRKDVMLSKEEQNQLLDNPNKLKTKGSLVIETKLKQETQRQTIRSAKKTERNALLEELQSLKLEYDIQPRSYKLIDRNQQGNCKEPGIKKTQPKLAFPARLNGSSSLKEFSKKRPQTAQLTNLKISTVPDDFKSIKEKSKEINEFNENNEIDLDTIEGNTHQDARSNGRITSAITMRCSSPKESGSVHQQFLCRVLRSERNAVFDRIKSNGVITSVQNREEQQKQQQENNQKKLLADKEGSENFEEIQIDLGYCQILKQQQSKQEDQQEQQQKQQKLGMVCPWQEWNEEIGYDDASLDFIHYAHSP